MNSTSSRFDPRSYQAPEGLLRERVILVTGAGDGIGRALSLACARLGATVVLVGRTRRKLESVYDDIVEGGHPQPAIAPIDFATATGEQYQSLIDAIEDEYGRLDGLVNNAAILGDRAPIEHYDIGTWQRVLHVNLTAPFIVTRCMLPLLKQSPDASVIFITSGVGRVGRAYWGAYGVSKFGIEGLNQILAQETERKENLRVNCINPGATRTNMRRRAYPAEDRDRLATPEQILGPYLFLLGPDGRGVNGESIDCQPLLRPDDGSSG